MTQYASLAPQCRLAFSLRSDYILPMAGSVERTFDVQIPLVRQAIADVYEQRAEESGRPIGLAVNGSTGDGELRFVAPEDVQDAVDDRLYVRRMFRF